MHYLTKQIKQEILQLIADNQKLYLAYPLNMQYYAFFLYYNSRTKRLDFAGGWQSTKACHIDIEYLYDIREKVFTKA